MTEQPMSFERQLEAAFRGYAEAAPVEVDVVAMVAGARAGAARRGGTPGATRARVRWVLLAAAALVAIGAAVALRIGSRPPLEVDVPPVLIPRVAYEGVFDRVGPIPTDLATETLVTLADGRVLGLGDSWPDRKPQSMWDPATGRFSATGLSVGKRQGPIGVLLRDGRVLIIGGDITDPVYDGEGGYSGTATYSTAEVFDPATGTFTATGPLVGKGWAPQAIRMADGRVLVLDGISVDDAESSEPLLATAEIYDPATNTFSATGDMSTKRRGEMALLPDGRVLVVGGHAPELGFGELFDPATGTFTRTGPLPPSGGRSAGDETARPSGAVKASRGPADQVWPEVAAAAVTLPDGRVLIPGRHCDEIGDEGSFPTTAAIFDPATSEFTPSPDMPHCVDQAIPLADGRILLTSFWGETNWGGIYDPTDGSITETEAPPAGRYMDLAPLHDGRVLVIGGGQVAVFR